MIISRFSGNAHLRCVAICIEFTSRHKWYPRVHLLLLRYDATWLTLRSFRLAILGPFSLLESPKAGWNLYELITGKFSANDPSLACVVPVWYPGPNSGLIGLLGNMAELCGNRTIVACGGASYAPRTFFMLSVPHVTLTWLKLCKRNLLSCCYNAKETENDCNYVCVHSLILLVFC